MKLGSDADASRSDGCLPRMDCHSSVGLFGGIDPGSILYFSVDRFLTFQCQNSKGIPVARHAQTNDIKLHALLQ